MSRRIIGNRPEKEEDIYELRYYVWAAMTRRMGRYSEKRHDLFRNIEQQVWIRLIKAYRTYEPSKGGWGARAVATIELSVKSAVDHAGRRAAAKGRELEVLFDDFDDLPVPEEGGEDDYREAVDVLLSCAGEGEEKDVLRALAAKAGSYTEAAKLLGIYRERIALVVKRFVASEGGARAREILYSR